jgi:hypothetical protein
MPEKVDITTKIKLIEFIGIAAGSILIENVKFFITSTTSCSIWARMHSFT